MEEWTTKDFHISDGLVLLWTIKEHSKYVLLLGFISPLTSCGDRQ